MNKELMLKMERNLFPDQFFKKHINYKKSTKKQPRVIKDFRNAFRFSTKLFRSSKLMDSTSFSLLISRNTIKQEVVV